MWYDEEESVAPTVLKRAIGKFQPMFMGYDQHDSGELISYLLDGLHEDLNRVKLKPYTETKDYDGRPDEVVAKESWEQFLMRNQSIIVDLMYGQYKSRLQCPKCAKVSVTFDPFLMVPLPVPQNTNKIFELLYEK
jgi:ubiquitin carboxyl-terminal hydrolase 4/11/15